MITTNRCMNTFEYGGSTYAKSGDEIYFVTRSDKDVAYTANKLREIFGIPKNKYVYSTKMRKVMIRINEGRSKTIESHSSISGKIPEIHRDKIIKLMCFRNMVGIRPCGIRSMVMISDRDIIETHENKWADITNYSQKIPIKDLSHFGDSSPEEKTIKIFNIPIDDEERRIFCCSVSEKIRNYCEEFRPHWLYKRIMRIFLVGS